MYLVFDLPKLEGVHPSPHEVAVLLHREFERWHKQYQITYKTKFHKTRLRLILKDEEEYTFFLMSWQPNPYIQGARIEDEWLKPRMIDPPKH